MGTAQRSPRVALWILGVALINHDGPADHATDAQILDYYKANSNWILLGGWFFMLGCLAFLWFAELLRERFEDARRSPHGNAADVRRGRRSHCVRDHDPADRHRGGDQQERHQRSHRGAAHRFSDGFFVGAEIGLIPVFLAGAVAALSSRLLPKWWAWLMILVAIVLVIGPDRLGRR